MLDLKRCTIGDFRVAFRLCFKASTRTRFETEAKSHSEIAYLFLLEKQQQQKASIVISLRTVARPADDFFLHAPHTPLSTSMT